MGNKKQKLKKEGVRPFTLTEKAADAVWLLIESAIENRKKKKSGKKVKAQK